MTTPQTGSIDRPNAPQEASVGNTARSNDMSGHDVGGHDVSGRARAITGIDDATDNPDGRATIESLRKASRPVEIGGQAGPEPTRYGDWEKKGRCTDF